VQPQLVRQKLELAVSIPPGVRLYTDRKRLLQCLLNYLSNAVKFTEVGKISIAAREIDGHIEIAVSDTGIGIREEDLPKLFQPFARLDSPLKIKSQGTGLGLYLTRKLVTEVLGGIVDVKSRPQKGSTFSFMVPQKIGKEQTREEVCNEDSTGN
jgi:signal transduction histidine kinase